jgi:hypothetical protein
LAREFLAAESVEAGAQVSVTETIDSKLAIGQSLTQQSVFDRPGAKRTITLALMSKGRAHFAHQLAQRGGARGGSQRIKIAFIGGAGDFGPPWQIG